MRVLNRDVACSVPVVQEVFEKRRALVKLLVAGITAGRDEDGQVDVQITYRFGPPAPSHAEDMFVAGVQSSSGLRAFILSYMRGAPIILVGGLAAWPWRYRQFALVLREISGSEVHVAPITPLDWILGRIRGYGQLVFEVASTVDRALLESDADKAVLVGHSAGGIACRVYVGGDPPYGGRRYSGHRRVSHLITLGSPHVVADKGSLAPIAQVNEHFPGALHEPSGLKYVSVAGGAADGETSSRVRKRYERLVDNGRVAGDGVVPVESALLPGSETLVLDDLYHSHYYGRWYGSDRETVERWWPEELRASGSLVEECRA